MKKATDIYCLLSRCVLPAISLRLTRKESLWFTTIKNPDVHREAKNQIRANILEIPKSDLALSLSLPSLFISPFAFSFTETVLFPCNKHESQHNVQHWLISIYRDQKQLNPYHLPFFDSWSWEQEETSSFSKKDLWHCQLNLTIWWCLQLTFPNWFVEKWKIFRCETDEEDNFNGLFSFNLISRTSSAPSTPSAHPIPCGSCSSAWHQFVCPVHLRWWHQPLGCRGGQQA